MSVAIHTLRQATKKTGAEVKVLATPEVTFVTVREPGRTYLEKEIYEGKDNMSRQVDKKKTVQVRVDARTHYYAKIKAAEQSKSLRTVVDSLLCDWLSEDFPEGDNHAD